MLAVIVHKSSLVNPRIKDFASGRLDASSGYKSLYCITLKSSISKIIKHAKRLHPAAAKREDGPWAEPPGALELQQSESVYSDCGAGLNRDMYKVPYPRTHTRILSNLRYSNSHNRLPGIKEPSSPPQSRSTLPCHPTYGKHTLE